MTDEVLYIVGGIIIGVLVLFISYKLLTIATTQTLKQNMLSNFNNLRSAIDTVCWQEVRNSMVVDMSVPNSIRAIYTTNDTENALTSVTDQIKDGRISIGQNICLQFKTEQELRCHKLKCRTFMQYLGALDTYNDLQLLVNKILGKPLTKEYSIVLTKTNTGAEVIPENSDYFKMPVLVISYIPIDTNKKVDVSKTGSWKDPDINKLRAKISDSNKKFSESLIDGSKYHGYKIPSATPSLNYFIVDEKEFLGEIPTSPITKAPGTGTDYFKILKRDVDVCNYVDNGDVKEVWIWTYESDKIRSISTNMAWGYKIKDYWNYIDSIDDSKSYGDLSIYSENDLPICQKTYTVYNYYYKENFDEMPDLHSYQFDLIVGNIGNNKDVYGSFTKSCGANICPPNTNCPTESWCSKITVQSDCEDWKPTGGEKKQISCYNWDSDCKGDCEASFKIWWMQNIPGKNNNLKTSDGKNVENWWEYIGDFDNAMKTGKLIAGKNVKK